MIPLNLDQNSTPLFDAVKKYVDDKVIPFHVPGHKQGAGLREFAAYIGDRILQMDANGMDDLDYANNPSGVILEAEKLMADAYGAGNAFFLVNGTTSGVQAMILEACKPGSKILIPRNAHKSTIGGIILSGAIPCYIQPQINKELGIAMGVTLSSVKEAIKKNPDAEALFLINPTYYGAASDLKALVRTAHANGIKVLVDEAHGAHMPFHEDFPLAAMEADADMSAVSLHKTAGSMTQSSALLTNKRIDSEHVRQVLNLTYTSSASYILMCSLDIARKQLATRGNEMLSKALRLARAAREEINKIEGLYAFGRELIGTPGCFDFDETKLGINVRKLGYTGYQMERKLREGYNIQVEMADLYNVLALVTLGDSESNLDALVSALKDIARKTYVREIKNNTIIPVNPDLIVPPREAFYSPKRSVGLDESVGEISGEMIMAYPPGIPVIGLGERITREIIDYIKILKSEKCQLQGASDPNVEYIKVIK
ncbi:aminotransferase class I/II-fold pyridoxal phosphate-dependent enzyme [[Clostridium] cellulosi]